MEELDYTTLYKLKILYFRNNNYSQDKNYYKRICLKLLSTIENPVRDIQKYVYNYLANILNFCICICMAKLLGIDQATLLNKTIGSSKRKFRNWRENNFGAYVCIKLEFCKKL